MGAGCSNRNSVAVQDSVQTTDINQLTKEAQQHLKAIQQQEGKTGLDQEKLIKSNKEEDDVNDKDQGIEDQNRIKHQALWDAVELNDSTKVISYLEEYEEKQGEELKETELYDKSGNSVLHKAASLGHANILMLLLERTGAKPDLVNSSFATPLHLAVKNNRIDAAKFLIGCGVDANCQDEHGQGPLLICSIHGHFELTRMLIEASSSGLLPEPIEVDIKDHRGLSPLNCAAIKGDFDLVKLLVVNGSASLDQTSPKGCTPLLYAARGGYSEVVRFLILRGASALRQDNAGGTVLHHAIEKGHVEVLHILQEFGVDVHSAIEIPDNAGRTPIFEAVDNHETPDIIKLLTKDRKQGGFDAKVNIMNYNGQTPLFSACREGNLEVVQALVEECAAKVDMTQGELFKEDVDEGDYSYDSMQEKFFMDAYKNCMTPLQVAVVLGYESIMHYLIEKGANPNLQTKVKGYSCLHLAVLANKPEIVIELLTKTQANPYLPDFGGRTLQDMIEIFIPSYLESFKQLLENLQYIKQKGLQEADPSQPSQQMESLAGLVSGADESESGPTVATHYYNPDDERTLQGVGADEGKINDLYNKKAADESEQDKEREANAAQEGQDKKNAYVNFHFMDDADIKTEADAILDSKIEEVFGRKVALAMNAIDWKFKEIAMKVIYKFTEKYLDVQNQQEQTVTIDDLTQACASAVSYTCKEKVIKVFMISLQLLNLLVSSTKIEKTGTTQVLKNTIVEKNVVLKLLQKTEEGNTRITNKIHESLLDLSFNPEVGEALTSSFILQRIQAHNRANSQKIAQKNAAATEAVKDTAQQEQIETEAALGSFKGLLAQLALLYKFINSFGIASRNRGPLSVKDVLKSIMPAIQHPNQDVRNASGKILMDVHKLSGCVTEEELESIGEKARAVLMTKISKIEVEKNLMDSHARNKMNAESSVVAIKEEEEGEQTDRAEVPETISTSQSPKKADIQAAAFVEKKAIIEEKGNSKEWQEREVALKAVEDVFTERRGKHVISDQDLLEVNFLQNCLILLKTCFEENNMTIYLQAIQVGSVFFAKALVSEVVQGSLQSLIQPIILRTNDTNTRIRKKSVDLVYQIWDFKLSLGNEKLKFGAVRDSQDHNDANSRAQPICQVIAQVICDSQLGEKSIIGRLGLFIRRAQQIEGGKDLSQKPLAMMLGKNYEQLTEFACQWVSHKNTKVRQNALKLITEICRINCLDPRGTPFKQRIVNFILALRSTQRDPLVVKINEICLKHIVANTSPGRASSLEPYININELDLNLATKNRAASMDHMTAKRRLQSASRGSKRGNTGSGAAESQSILPTIGIPKGPSNAIGVGLVQPTTVLPHSEALSPEQINEHQNLIDLFGIQIITCFLSKSWSTRQTCICKIQEQLVNLDPSRRDAMSAEINTKNLPIELNYKTFIELISEGLKDPVLKNFLMLLELTQMALPTFFRYIQPHAIRNEIKTIVQGILKKTADMKQKIREAAINFCLYLSHQSPVGPEFMVEQVLLELDFVQNETKESTQNQDQAASTTFGNSHMITSCLGLLNEYQVQTQILSPERDTPTLLKKFMDQVNSGLKHSNPQVRKEAEKLFKTLYCDFGQQLEALLEDQKPALLQKLLKQAKQEVVAKHNMRTTTQQASQQPNKVAQGITDEQKTDTNVQRAQDRIRDQVIDQSQLKQILEGAEEHLQALKLPNPRKRQKAIVEIKKAISKKIVGAELSQQKARDLFEPLTLLMRQLLQDDHPDIYLESLNLLKFIVGSLAPYLSTLDLHLMMGSFIGIIVQNTVSGNMRIQVSSDKVIVFFAKHQNIGPCIVAKEVTKNIDKINKAINNAVQNRAQVFNEKRSTLLRFFGILKLLLQQFSIILCYQQDFYIQCLECIADSMNLGSGKGSQPEGEEVAVRSVCTQIVYNLYAIDYKLLDTSVSGLNDLNRKTPLRKAIIEYETQQKQGKGYIDVNSQESSLIVHGVSPSPLNQSVDKMRDTQMSFASSTNRQSLFSPGSTLTRGQSPGGFGASQYEGNWGGRFKLDQQDSESRKTIDLGGSRRMMSLGEKRNPGTNQSGNASYLANHPISNLTQSSWRRDQDVLPALDSATNLNRTGVLLPHISNPGLGVGAGLTPSYTFESRQHAVSEVNPKRGNLKQHKLKSTGGAGFSSQNTATDASFSQNEPPREQKPRTPRRALGVLVNNNIGANTSELGSSAGLGGANKISWPSQAAQNLKQPESGADSAARIGSRQNQSGGVVKPPLYVPARRQPSENSRTINQAQQASDPSGYVSKTGFSMGSSSPSGQPPKPRRPSFTNNESGYVPSAMGEQAKRR